MTGFGACDPNQKPRSHDTSRIAWAKLLPRVGEEFPLERPNGGGDIRLIAFRLLSECETIPGLRTRGNLRLLRTSCPRAGPDPEDTHTAWRTARATASLAGPATAHRLGPGASSSRLMTTAKRSGVARRAARDRHPQPLTGAGREASSPRTGDPGNGLRRGEKIAIATRTALRGPKRTSSERGTGSPVRWPKPPAPTSPGP